MNEAGREVMSNEGGYQATATQRKLDKLNENWETVLAKTHEKQIALEDALREVRFQFLLLLFSFPVCFFMGYAIRLWNSLPAEMKKTCCLVTFKRLLKTHLYRAVYDMSVYLICIFLSIYYLVHVLH